MSNLRLVPSGPQVLHWSVVMRARAILREGWSLRVTAATLDVSPADLDLSLWRNLGKKWS